MPYHQDTMPYFFLQAAGDKPIPMQSHRHGWLNTEGLEVFMLHSNGLWVSQGGKLLVCK